MRNGYGKLMPLRAHSVLVFVASGVARRSVHSSSYLLGFRGLGPIKCVKDVDEKPNFVSTSWQHESDEQVSRWVRKSDGRIFKVKSLTRMDVDLLDQAGLQEPDVYVALLRECGDARAFSDGKRVHAHLAMGALDKETYIGNLVVQMYGKCRSMKDARLVFDNIQEPNVFSWNIIVTAYAQNGDLQEAKCMFDRMSQRNLVSWNTMVAAYAQNGRVEDSRTMFENMPKWSEVSWTTMIAAYAQDGNLLEAMSFFNRMPRQDVVAWTTVITAYAQKGHNREALCLFRKLNLEGLQPDKVTLLSVLDACEAREDGAGIHANILERGFQTDVAVGTALVNMYGRCGCLETARNIFVKIQEKDVVSWTAIITAYANNGHLEVAKHMLERSPLKNTVSWNVVIAAYAQNGYLQEARTMFDKLAERDAVSWTAMIAGYAQNGQGKKSLELFKLMVLDGVHLDKVTLISMLYVCASVPALRVGELIHAHILDSKLPIDITLGTALLNMYGKCGKIAKARSLFDKIQHKDIVFWNTMIATYAQNGLGKDALDLHQEMVHEGMQWDAITFTNVLSACSHAGLHQEGRAYFVFMRKDYGIEHTVDHYVCMIDLLARGGQVYAARELIDNMPFQPHAAAWSTFLAACRTHGQAEHATEAAIEVIEVDQQNAAPYMLIADIVSGS